MLTRSKRKRFVFTLPDEMWKYIFLFMETVCNVSQVCRSFQIIINNTWKQLLVRDFPTGYDVYNIESQCTHVDYKKTYRILKTHGPTIVNFVAKDLKQAVDNYYILLQLVGKSSREYCSKLLDNLCYMNTHSAKSEQQPIFTKLEKFVNLFQSYNLKDFICLYMIGFILHHVFGKREEACQYYKMAIPLNIRNSFACLIEMIRCIDEPENLKLMCESYYKIFPTRKYAIMFALANRLVVINTYGSTPISVEHTILPIAFETLQEYDTKQPDDLYINEHQDASRLDILRLIGDLYGQKVEALIYYKQILNYTQPFNHDFKFETTIKTVSILYHQKDTIEEAFHYLENVGYAKGNEIFDWMIKIGRAHV